jgi:hypothetical protein
MVEKVYRSLKKSISDLSEDQLLHIQDPTLRLILQRTQNFHTYKKMVANSVLRNRSVSDLLLLRIFKCPLLNRESKANVQVL